MKQESVSNLETRYQYCLRCGRKLKNEKARYIGYGKTCLEKANASRIQPRLFTPTPTSTPLVSNTNDNTERESGSEVVEKHKERVRKQRILNNALDAILGLFT